jgi:hypothetical protein
MLNWYLLIVLLSLGLPFVIAFVTKWVVVPINIHRNQHMTQQPNLRHATADDITPELSQLLQTVLPQFRAEGFESAAMTCNADTVPNVRSVQATLVNRATNDVAMILGAWGKGTRALVYAVRSEFADDTIVTTGVHRSIGVFTRDPADDSVGFSRLSDIHALCEFHRRRLRHLGIENRARRLLPPGAEIDRLNREWQRTTARLVRTGYKYFDPSAQVFRYTWKGAFLSAWRLTQPIKGWRIQRRDRRALALWHELKMPGLPTDVRPVAPPQSAFAETTVAPASNAADLSYEVALAEGEIRFEPTAAGLTIRIGTLTIFQSLARRWSSLLWMMICAAGLSWYLFKYWLIQSRLARMGIPLPFSMLQLPMIALAIFLVLDVVKLIRGVITLRGTIVLTASPQGLTYRNIPAVTNSSGQIARDDLRGFLVVPVSTGFRRILSGLVALTEDRGRQVLCFAHDTQSLERVRASLAQALGIEAPAIQPQPS